MISPDPWLASQPWLTQPRRDLYLYVSAQPAPVSRDQAADALGAARHTAKFHLDKLAAEGLLEISFRRLSERRGPGAGRPTRLYARSSRLLSVILPPPIEKAATQSTPPADALKTVAAGWARGVTEHA